MTSASLTHRARSAAVPSTAPKYTHPCSRIASRTSSERRPLPIMPRSPRSTRSGEYGSMREAVVGPAGPRACPGRAGGVTVEIYGDREGGDVGREALHVHRERRHGAAVSCGADACRVDLLQKLPLDLGYLRVGVGRTGGAGEGLLGELGSLLERTTDADAYCERWAGVRAGLLDGLDDEPLHRGQPFRRREHLQRAHVVAARTLDE